MTSLAILLTVASLSAPPVIDALSIDPIPLGATVEVTGTGFVDGQTSVTISTHPQKVVFVTESKVVFTVPIATPLGTGALVLTTPEGNATTDVEVTPAPPKMTEISPEPVIIGGLLTIKGSNLGLVSELTLGEVTCNITTQTDAVLVAEVPFLTDLIGEVALKIEGTNGYDIENVMVVAPKPSINGISPNPVRQGDIVTLTGPIAAWANKVEIGGIAAKVIEAKQGEVKAQVPPTIPMGPWMVVVKVGDLASDEVGPLHITQADPKRPVIKAPYPASITTGANVWLVGENLDQIDTLSHGLTRSETCEKNICLVSTEGVPTGVHTVSATGSKGTDIFTLAIEDDAGVIPEITSAEPKPAFRGEELIVRGSNLFETIAVVIGGQTQTITYVGEEEVKIVVHELTPMGAETLFVAGKGGSNALSTTILEPFPSPDTTVEPDGAESDSGGQDLGPDALPENDGAAQDTRDENEVPGQVDEGCQGGGLPAIPHPFWLLALYGFLRTSKNSRLPFGP